MILDNKFEKMWR